VPEPVERALPSVYQLRIVLRAISPLIWRRLRVSACDSIADLHAALQIAFAWDGSHPHRFVIHGREYGHDSPLDPREVRLGDLGLRIGERFIYEYDFTDYWVHDIRLEAIHEAQPGRRYPVLTGGQRSAPRIARHARKTILRLSRDWPWAAQLAAAFKRLQALPPPTG
jgi:hypothetical protein